MINAAGSLPKEVMEALQAIYSRRSIRKYKKAQVPFDFLEEILKAGMVAPSALDERPWHFVVIDDQEVLAKLAGELEHCGMLSEAAAAVLVCGDERLEKIKGFWPQDCSACAENILLAAHALGLGAVWLAVFPLEDRMSVLRTTHQLPPHIIPFALIPLGWPGEDLGAEDRYDKGKVHFNRWNLHDRT